MEINVIKNAHLQKLSKIDVRLNEVTTAIEALVTSKEQPVPSEVLTENEQATEVVNEQDSTHVTTTEQSASVQVNEDDEAQKQEELDKWMGKLISTSNQLKAVKNEMRALEKKVSANDANMQALKEKVKMLEEKVQQNKKKLLELL
ncbi:hypothetical protein [uncultured Anoxybacillus sp.]|uniref:hypothetical protein n=1 Tax=uncultured Anoxybacillus sp. TaxID=263860 RepID=UPI00261284F2|nr:hypothetical protein [uncultured Anoxybacillus sp.]